MSDKRRPILRKVQSMVLYISVAALLITTIVGILSMRRIQKDSEDALLNQMVQNMYNMTMNKAELAEAQLSKYSGFIREFARFASTLYMTSNDYSPVEVHRSSAANAGRFTMQLDLAHDGIEYEKIKPEVGLIGNIEKVWSAVIPANEDVITTVYIATESGFIIAYDKNSQNVEDGEYYNFLSLSWYKNTKALGRDIFTDVYEDAFGRGLTITCAAPFYDAQNNFAGVVAMDILISDFYRAIVDVQLGDEVYAFLVDGEGKRIDQQTEEIDNLRDNQMMSDNVVEAILAGETGVTRADSGIYYAYTPIESAGWMFCLRVPQDVILAPVRDVNRNIILTIISFLAAFIVIIAMVFVISRKFSEKLTRPIISLGHDVEKISGGNLDYRAEIQDNDEIGDLAKNFNDMAASLKEYVKNLAHVTAEKERISTELNLATQIQADMLPRIFPPFPDRDEFDIYATMTPAKEVGGDFYDFFFVDKDHIALVIADVSGKGVPAALFMVIAKTLIKTRSQMGGTPSEILADVNRQLCESNEADLFVTVWLGILEISTGHVIASNAGHEYPAIRKKGGDYELFRTKQSPAVATMEGLKFRQYEFDLNPGDIIYLYTDGVAEATNSDEELYGTDRMLEDLNKTKKRSSEEILKLMKQSVDDFTGEAPQFDDITMLCLRYFGGKNFVKEITTDADVNNLDEVIAFVNEQLEVHDCSPKVQMQIDVAVEELFVNIAHYAYNPDTGPATVRVELQENPLSVVITFIDNGVPYDPLAKPDPDVTLSAEEREIGGLGIYMVKKSMDNIEYEYKDGQNILRIQKNLS